MSPTIVTSATSAGMIMGTAPYMSPEQARGRDVDRRTDIWAFGVVLFRMLTGSRMFEGDTVTDTLAKILEREPEWELLPPETPSALRQLLQRCLTKNPKNRLQSIGDARILIQELIEQPQQPEKSAVVVARTSSPLWTRVLPWATAVVCLAGGLVFWCGGRRRRPTGRRCNSSIRCLPAISSHTPTGTRSRSRPMDDAWRL